MRGWVLAALLSTGAAAVLLGVLRSTAVAPAVDGATAVRQPDAGTGSGSDADADTGSGSGSDARAGSDSEVETEVIGGAHPLERALAPLHRRNGPPQPGDWRDAFTEPTQSYVAYRDARPPAAVAAELTTIYIQALGPLQPAQRAALEDAGALASRFFAAPVERLPALPLELIPTAARRRRGGVVQLSTRYILEWVLAPRRPDDALAVLAVTASDLAPGEGWNFVFGEASLDARVGVWSVHRYGDAGAGGRVGARFRRRLFKITLHELGHVFGLHHCSDYACLMNGVNHLQELDRSPLALCPPCLRKLLLARGVGAAARFGELADFADAHRLREEARTWRASAAALDGDIRH